MKRVMPGVSMKILKGRPGVGVNILKTPSARRKSFSAVAVAMNERLPSAVSPTYLSPLLSRANYMHSDAASQGGGWWQGVGAWLTS